MHWCYPGPKMCKSVLYGASMGWIHILGSFIWILNYWIIYVDMQKISLYWPSIWNFNITWISNPCLCSGSINGHRQTKERPGESLWNWAILVNIQKSTTSDVQCARHHERSKRVQLHNIARTFSCSLRRVIKRKFMWTFLLIAVRRFPCGHPGPRDCER